MKINKIANTKNINIGKFLALILRHKPEVVNISLDSNGWANVNELVEKINLHYNKDVVDLPMIQEIVANDDKNRYELRNGRIRARQGHSLSVDLSLEAKRPPNRLYHGTVRKFIDSIFDKGLIKGSRQYVHLSKDVETAIIVGGRRGEPIILSIDAGRMYGDGFEFFISTNGVWLTDHVPSEYISINS